MTSSRSATNAAEVSHVRSLDGLRFFAFFGVFVFHALQNNQNAFVRKLVAYGSLGVQVFFVLSGFLIGGILLEQRAQTGVPLGRRLKTFYARRALRIFPLYYLALLLLLVLPSVGVTAIGGNDDFFWNATYLTNIKSYFGGGIPGGLAHLWSLSVEEHFYLLAPLLLLTLSTRALSLGFVTLWIGCALARVVFSIRGDTEAYMLSPMQFDCMTIGVAAAMLQTDGTFLGLRRPAADRVAILCAALVVPLFALRHVPYRPVYLIGQALEHWVFSVAWAGFVLALWDARLPRISRALAREPLPYLGKISYGLYVFHLPCLVLCYVWLRGFMTHGTAVPALFMTLALSALSWHFLEKPINDLKRRFPYRSSRTASVAPERMSAIS